MNFQELATVQNVQIPLKPAALRIYRSIFRGCRIEDLRELGVKVHVLDKEFGIDSLIHMPTGQWFSIQEKYREYPKYGFHDFTQEIANGDGSPGEWQHLGSQFYFYGWGDHCKTHFMEWFIMNVVHYKIIVERAGGIEKIGTLQQNSWHGKSKFVGVPFVLIRPAIQYFGNGIVYLKRISTEHFSEPMLLEKL